MAAASASADVLVAVPDIDDRIVERLANCHATFVRTFEDAERALREHLFKLIVIDLSFDNVRVFDLLQLVRSLGRSDRVPIFCVQVSELGAGFQRFCQLIAAELGVDGPAVRLPAQAEGPKTVDARATDAQFHHQCILIIDHDVDAAQSLGMILERIGHEVDFAYDGIAGLDAARRLRPDVVFLDPALPRSDGYELARRLRREPHLRNILIVALSDAGHEKERQRTRDAGFDHHLDKPVDPQFIKQLLVQRR